MKILRESKNQKWEEREDDGNDDVVDSTGGKMGSYQAQVANNDYGSEPGQRPAPAQGVNLLADDDEPEMVQRPQQTQSQPVRQQQTNPFGEEDLLGAGPGPAQIAPASYKNIKIPMSTVGSLDSPGGSGDFPRSEDEEKRAQSDGSGAKRRPEHRDEDSGR